MAPDDIFQPRIVNTITPMDAVVATHSSEDKSRQQHKKEHRPQKKVRDYFHPLSKAVEATNKRLVAKELPYRFNVFKRWGEVYIERCILNSDGSIRQKQQKNISHDDFNRIIDDVVSIVGLFFDQRA